MKKVLMLLLGCYLSLSAMQPPEEPGDGKQKGHRELIKRNVLSSGSVAPSSSITKVTSTSTMTSDGRTSPDSSSLESDMAQIDLDKDGHVTTLTKAQKRRSLLPIELEYLDDAIAAERILKLMEARDQQKKQQQEAVATRLVTNHKKEKRKSVDLYLKAKHIIPQLPLGDIELGIKKSDISDEEWERIISFISQATGNNVSDIKDRLKVKLKELHNTPPASPLFSQQASAIDALNTVRKLTSNHVSTTRVVESLKRQAQPVHTLPAADVITLEGFEKGLGELLKLVNTELATKLTQTGKSRSLYRVASGVTTAATVGLGIYELYKRAAGDSTTPTCPPTNTTFPM